MIEIITYNSHAESVSDPSRAWQQHKICRCRFVNGRHSDVPLNGDAEHVFAEPNDFRLFQKLRRDRNAHECGFWQRQVLFGTVAASAS